tara:strand:- start:3749 stop:4645 length:897 start_codon:yes stop_codon:yes gene_type:complete
MKKNKYLISSGCSFTAGHTIGETASWATHLAQELDLELINFGKGGSGNELIVNKVIDYGTLRPDIAQDSLFVIQLSECLRYMLPYENLDDYSKSNYTHITPNQFIKENAWTSWTWGDLNQPMEALKKWVYDNRHVLAPLYLNITYSLKKTYNDIINLVNFCESNNYPYLIFDGVNNHIPYEENGEWYLSGSNTTENFLIHTLDLDKELVYATNVEPRKYTLEDNFKEVKHLYPFYILKNMIEYMKTLKYYYHGTTLHTFIYHESKDGSFPRLTDGHPNVLGAKMWAKHLVQVLEKYYE